MPNLKLSPPGSVDRNLPPMDIVSPIGGGLGSQNSVPLPGKQSLNIKAVQKKTNLNSRRLEPLQASQNVSPSPDAAPMEPVSKEHAALHSKTRPLSIDDDSSAPEFH